MEYRVIRSGDYLEHHGILGQKWGVRRYQNKDGSLTPEGKERYRSEMKSLGEELLKAKDHKTVYDKLNTSQAVKEFNENNKYYRKLKRTNELLKNDAKMFTEVVNKELTKQYGNFLDLPFDQQREYFMRGVFYTQSLINNSARYQGLLQRQDYLSKKYEASAKKFVSDCFEEIGDKPVSIPTALTINLNTGKVTTSVLNDTAVIEMLRAAGGRMLRSD